MWAALSSLFWPSYEESKYKTALRTAVIRVDTRRKKLIEQVKVKKREISKLLDEGGNEMTQIRAEKVLRDERMIEALDLLGIFLKLLSERIMLVSGAAAGDFPVELGEAASSVIWASVRVPVPELRDIGDQLYLKFGQEAVKTALSNGNSWVSEPLMQLLGPDAPPEEEVDTLVDELSPVPLARTAQRPDAPRAHSSGASSGVSSSLSLSSSPSPAAAAAQPKENVTHKDILDLESRFQDLKKDAD